MMKSTTMGTKAVGCGNMTGRRPASGLRQVLGGVALVATLAVAARAALAAAGIPAEPEPAPPTLEDVIVETGER